MSLLLLQFITLSIIALFVGICFCDGFNVPIPKKLIFFSAYAANAYIVLRATGTYALEMILPIPILVAMLLCWSEKYFKKPTNPFF
ncbi:hypothetical protein ACFL96_04735 [Thermoproteota archaeon]